MKKRKAKELEVMALEITAAQKNLSEVMARLNTLVAMDSTDWKPGWVAGLYERKLELMNSRVWLAGWLDSIEQMR
jgi:hypothetical protein